jgi:hypothetical protein
MTVVFGSSWCIGIDGVARIQQMDHGYAPS